MATIRQIAAEAGVSPAAVSRILNNDPRMSVSPETRQRVIRIAKEAGYEKKGGRDKAKFRLGILQWFSSEQEMEDDYYLQIRKGIEEYCAGRAISIARRYRSDMDYADGLNDLDGLICVGKFTRGETEKLIDINSNIIFVDMTVPHPAVTSIAPDLYEATMTALTYLESLGHKDIAYIGGIEYASGDSEESVADMRREAYLTYMSQKGRDTKGLFLEGRFTTSSGYELTGRLLKKKKHPGAILAASDSMAAGAIKAVTDAGLKVPDDISVMGINDNEMSRYITPALTTVRIPAYDMGVHAANILFMSSDLNIKTPLRVTVPCTLVQRESCSGISMI